MQRALHLVAVGLAALTGLRCFAIEPLPDCSSQDGLYIAHHVCMPLAREPLVLGRAPREIAAGDFDGDGTLDDLAILSDPDHASVYSALDRATPALRELRFTEDGATVAGFLAAPFFPGGHGDDLFAWLPRDSLVISEVVALPNGGDNFAGEALSTPLFGFQIGDDGKPAGPPLPCYAPNGGLALRSQLPKVGNVVMITCLPDLALGGGDFEGLLADQLPDAVAVSSRMGFTGAAAALVASEYRSMGAAHLAVFDPGSDDIEFVFAHRPNPGADAELAIVRVEELDPTGAIAVQPRQGSIDEVRVADLDLDDDVDLLTIHRERNGFSIIRQQPHDGAARVFGEPEFYTLELELSDIVVADFTGDGGLDIAVAHNIDNTSLDGITIFALDREQPGGPVPYAPATVGYVQGAIVAMTTLDLDADDDDDLAVAVRDGSKGYVNFYVNNSPGDR